MRRIGNWGALAVVLLLVTAVTSHASAQDYGEPIVTDPADLPDPPSHRLTRSFGFGTSHGAGAAAASISDFGGGSTLVFGFALLLPTLETIIFLGEGDDLALEISIPVSNIVAVSAFAQAFVWNTQVYLTFQPGDDVRFIGGPGLGFSVVAVGGLSGFSLRIPATLGVEFLTPAKSVGFRIVTRPFVELAFVGSGGPLVGGGALLELAFNFYVTSDE